MGARRAGAILLVALGAGCAGEADDHAAPLVVFAAASTTDALQSIADDFRLLERRRVAASFAASSTLARQIEAGADCDLFVSADQRWMDELVEAGRIDPSTRFDLAANRLVIVARTDGEPIDFDAPAGPAPPPGAVAIADPSHVPAGRYAREALESLGWWEALAPRLVTAPDVRAALRLVEIGEVDFGVVYATDAAASRRVVVVGRIPERAHTPVRYPVALCVGADPAASRLLAYLESDEARRRLAEAGFSTPSREPAAP